MSVGPFPILYHPPTNYKGDEKALEHVERGPRIERRVGIVEGFQKRVKDSSIQGYMITQADFYWDSNEHQTSQPRCECKVHVEDEALNTSCSVS